MVAVVVSNNGAAITAPGSWNVADSRATGATTGDVRMSIYWKVASAAETSSYSWTSTASLDGAILVYAGVDTTSPVDAVGSQANAASTTVTAPAITTAKANDVLLGFFASDAGTSDPFTTSSGMYERVDTGQTPVVSMAAGDFAFAADEKTLGAAGPVASFAVTSSSSQKNVGTALALRPVDLQFTASSSSAWEAAGSAPVAVSLSSAVSLPTSIAYAATGGTATGSGTDYTLVAGTVSFAAGATSGSFSVTIVDDQVMDGGGSALDETVILTLSVPVNGNLGATATHTLTIKDDEPKTSATVVDGTGAATGTAWGGWTAAAGDANVASTNYLKVRNIDPDPAGRPLATVDFTPSSLAGTTDATQAIAVDNNLQFSCVEDATGSATPSSLTYPAFGSTSATASVTLAFTATTGSTFYCKHRVVAMPSPILDQTYSGAFTVTAT
jgi:hypothetical protein